MSDAEVMGSQFHAVLVEIDRELAAKARVHGCPYCGGKLHSAQYPRKPRGWPGAEVGGEMRLSYCCESCRRRTTPASVRFLGRRVYSAAVMVLGSALPGRLSVAAARTLCGALKEPKRTLERWRRWWRQSFVTTPQWILGGASFTTADAAHLNRPITRRVGSRAGNARRSEPLTRQKLNKLLYG